MPITTRININDGSTFTNTDTEAAKIPAELFFIQAFVNDQTIQNNPH